MTFESVLETVTGAATLTEIERILARTWAANAHVPRLVRLQVGIAVGEIGANIVEHTAPGESVPMRMAVHVLSDQVKVEFTHGGPPPAVDLEAARMPDVMAESGRGLAMARAVLEKLHFHRHTHNHWMLLSRKFAPA